MSKKPWLQLPALQTVEVILKQWDVLGYSTQKRNMAVWLQFRTYLKYLKSNYQIGGGMEKMLDLNLVRITSDIVEMALYCALDQWLLKPTWKKGKPGVTELINLATKHNMITKGAKKELLKLAKWRNEIHPDQHRTLHIAIGDQSIFNAEDKAPDLVLTDLTDYHNSFDQGR